MAVLATTRRLCKAAKAWLPPLNFITLHYAYFIITCLICAIILWGSSTPPRSVSFVDALFLVVSAMTEAGLNTINLSTLNTFQQFMLFLLIMLGSAIWVSAWVVIIRRNAFERRLQSVIAERKRRQRRRSHSRSRSRLAGLRQRLKPGEHPASAQAAGGQDAPEIVRYPGVTFDDSVAPKMATATPTYDTETIASASTAYLPTSRRDIGRYFESVSGWVSRNSGFHGLTPAERLKLGGWEYRAVSFLAILVPLYYVLWQLLGALGCAAWVAYNQPDTALSNGLNPWWVGAFNAVSAFNNSGMSLLDANMTAFQRSYYLLITMGLLILAGNTCYPIFLRLIVWTMFKICSRIPGERWEARTKTLRFLLDHPRRCYTNLFPARHTWWLLFAVITLNGIDWAAFEIFNIGNSLLDNTLPVNIRVIDGLFQAFAVRSGGFYVVTIPNLRIALLTLYVVMMYISPYPVVLALRNSNVYEERSLGVYADDPRYMDDYEPSMEKDDHSGKSYMRRAAGTAKKLVFGGQQTGQHTHFVRQQFRAQLSSDAWVVVLALILIMIIENQKFVDDPVNFSVFNVLFELVSGFGTVGISVGVPYDSYSFCGGWSSLSKLILCFVMLRGRHRGLPVAIDKAIMLPGDETEEAEEDDGRIRRAQSHILEERETV